MLLHGFALISSFSIMYPWLPLLFLWNKHSSGKINNSKQRPLDPFSYIHWGGRTVRQSIKKAFSRFAPFFGGGDLTIEGLLLGAYHELVPVDLKAVRFSMVLLRFNLISSFSIMNPSLSLLFFWNKHSSGKIKNSKQWPLEQRIHDPHSYIHWGGRTVRQSMKKHSLLKSFSFVLLTVRLEGQ